MTDASDVAAMIARDNDFLRIDRAKPGEFVVRLCADNQLEPFLRRTPILSWGVRRHDGLRVPITAEGPDHSAVAFQRPDGSIEIDGGAIFPNGQTYLEWNPREYNDEIVEVSGDISLMSPRGPVIVADRGGMTWRLSQGPLHFDTTGPGFTVRGRRADYDLIADWAFVTV